MSQPVQSQRVIKPVSVKAELCLFFPHIETDAVRHQDRGLSERSLYCDLFCYVLVLTSSEDFFQQRKLHLTLWISAFRESKKKKKGWCWERWVLYYHTSVVILQGGTVKSNKKPVLIDWSFLDRVSVCSGRMGLGGLGRWGAHRSQSQSHAIGSALTGGRWRKGKEPLLDQSKSKNE